MNHKLDKILTQKPATGKEGEKGVQKSAMGFSAMLSIFSIGR